MKQNIFETRQRAQELLDEAMRIWKQSPQSEHLEHLEKDPVMSLLMSALAYQANETDSDIEMLKNEVLSEYIHILTPYEMGHAVPATAVIEASLQDGVTEWMVGSDAAFTLSGTDYQFMPILRTKVINAQVQSIVRLDGRRWKVSLGFNAPIQNLSGFTFAIKNSFFEDLELSYGDSSIPLVKPWHYSKLPLNRCFSMDSMLYNGSQIFNASAVAMDLFARQNVRLFCIKEHDATSYLPQKVDEMDLIFEFTGITDEFVFDMKQLSLNCIILAETQQNYTTLSGTHPIARVAGYNDGDAENSQFLQLVRLTDEPFSSRERVEVRRISGDRFNQGSLLRLLSALINKYHSDFYAFQNQAELAEDGTMYALQDILQRLIKVCQNDMQHSMSGVYLLLHQEESGKGKEESMNVSYLTTHGACVNDSLDEESTFMLPAAFDTNACQQIAPPTLGFNEISDNVCEESLMRYHIITNDRIVTPADIKTFCYKELQIRYGVDSNMVESISVCHQLKDNPHGCGYEIVVEILLRESAYVKRSFANKIPYVEVLMQKMMEVRSTNIYPVRVRIRIENL